MKKLIMILCGVTLGSISPVMAEDMNVDTDDLMEEAPGISVTFSGEALMGLGRHSRKYPILPASLRSSFPDSDHNYLINQYEFTFSSSGITDSGLKFGGGISIEDKRAPGVTGSEVYVGSSDGVWKLQFGGNDPGMEASGYFGYPSANDLVYPGNEDTTIGIYGGFGNTTFRITRSDPGADENLWSAGANFAGEKFEVGLGMDNEASLIFVIGYKFPGVEAKYFYGTYDSFGVKHFSYDNHLDRYDGKDFGVQAIIDMGDRSTLTTSYSTREVNGQTVDEDGFSLPSAVLFHTDAKLIEVDFAHDLGGGITFKTELSQVNALTTLFEHDGPPLYSIKDTYLEMFLEMKF